MLKTNLLLKTHREKNK